MLPAEWQGLISTLQQSWALSAADMQWCASQPNALGSLLSAHDAREPSFMLCGVDARLAVANYEYSCSCLVQE